MRGPVSFVGGGRRRRLPSEPESGDDTGDTARSRKGLRRGGTQGDCGVRGVRYDSSGRGSGVGPGKDRLRRGRSVTSSVFRRSGRRSAVGRRLGWPLQGICRDLTGLGCGPRRRVRSGKVVVGRVGTQEDYGGSQSVGWVEARRQPGLGLAGERFKEVPRGRGSRSRRGDRTRGREARDRDGREVEGLGQGRHRRDVKRVVWTTGKGARRGRGRRTTNKGITTVRSSSRTGGPSREDPPRRERHVRVPGPGRTAWTRLSLPLTGLGGGRVVRGVYDPDPCHRDI